MLGKRQQLPNPIDKCVETQTKKHTDSVRDCCSRAEAHCVCWGS